MLRLSTFLLIIGLNACNNTQTNTGLCYSVLSESLETSTSLIKIQTQEKYNLLSEQLVNSERSEKTAYWRPCAEKIMRLSDNVIAYIEMIKQNAAIKSGITNYLHSLYDSLSVYQTSILNVDSEVNKVFRDRTLITNFFPDSIQSNYIHFEQAFISAGSPEAHSGLLNVLENRIRKTENKMVTFCYLKTGSLDEGGFDKLRVLVSQNKSIVIPGDTIEITAGLGSFSTAIRPEVRIFGKKIINQDNGIAVFKFTADKSSGKYDVPVEIDFIDEMTGEEKTVTKTVTYTVR